MKRFVSIILSAIVIAACSSQPERVQEPATDLLEVSVADATPVSDDANNIFSQLSSSPSERSQEKNQSTLPFYRPIGGESLAQVAYILYGEKDAKRLFKYNPGLKLRSPLLSSQEIYFSWEKINPEPRYLTKDLIDRYTGLLAAAIRERAGRLEKIQVKKGESLQSISQRLYGTTRYWTELYLLNHSTVKAYDRVLAGQQLETVSRVSLAQAPGSASNLEAPAGKELKPQQTTSAEQKSASDSVVSSIETPPATPPLLKPEETVATNVATVQSPPDDSPASARTEPVVEIPVPSESMIPVASSLSSDAKAEPAQLSRSDAEPKKDENIQKIETKYQPQNASEWELVLRRALYGGMILLVLFGVFALRRRQNPKISIKASGKTSPSPQALRVGVPLPKSALDEDQREKSKGVS